MFGGSSMTLEDVWKIDNYRAKCSTYLSYFSPSQARSAYCCVDGAHTLSKQCEIFIYGQFFMCTVHNARCQNFYKWSRIWDCRAVQSKAQMCFFYKQGDLSASEIPKAAWKTSQHWYITSYLLVKCVLLCPEWWMQFFLDFPWICQKKNS